MQVRTFRIIAGLAAPATLALVALLEFGAWKVISSLPSSDAPDPAFAWIQGALGLGVSGVLVALAAFLLYRSPGRLVASVYLLIGTYFTLARPLLSMAYGRQTFSAAITFFYALPFSQFIIGGHELVQLMPPFFVVLGVAALIRSRRAHTLSTPNHAMERTAGSFGSDLP